jgi:hypothetical protein
MNARALRALVFGLGPPVLTPGGYAVEASVSADEIGGNLVAGRKLGFDLLLSDGINP